ncbi:hypothetical protein CW304_27625 [Bacillus sp. UFRGS-B20]|nr:hypothetical protein CW304_27625 [Bacillus sp. UFRGS-B20]
MEHLILFKRFNQRKFMYGKDFSDVRKLCKLVKVANVHEFILSLPNQLDFHLNEECCLTYLNQARKQRFRQWARAIYIDPIYLFLDESF